MNTSYKPYNYNGYRYGSSRYSYTIKYSTTNGQEIYISYDNPSVPPVQEKELDVGDTAALDDFLKGFGVK